MTRIKTRLGLLAAVVAAVVGAVALGAAQASASSAPIVIPYGPKICDETTGQCAGPAGDGGTLTMQITSFRATGDAAQLTLTEWVTVGSVSFTAELNGHVSPAGFIVLDGVVTRGSFLGAQVHQRSDFFGLAGGDPTRTVWFGELRIMPASA